MKKLITLFFLIISFNAFAGETEKLIKDLSSSNNEVKREAARKLGYREHKNNPAIIKPLLEIVNNSSEKSYTKETAAETLGRNKSDAAINGLILIYNNSDFSDSAVLSGLIESGSSKAIPTLVNALEHNDKYIQRDAARGMRRFAKKYKDVIPPLLSVIKTTNDSLLAELAAESVARSSDNSATDGLLKIIEDKSLIYPDIATKAVIAALSDVNDLRAVPPLRSALKHDNPLIRREAAYSLKRYMHKDSSAVADLLDRLAFDHDYRVRQISADALSRNYDSKVVTGLIKIVNTTSSLGRADAARALGDLKSTKALTTLGNALLDQSSSKYLRREAAEALKRINSSSSLQIMMTVLTKDGDYRVREYAVKYLKAKLDPKSVPTLIKALNDDEGSVREDAAVALGKLKNKSALPDLIGLLDDKNERVRVAAINSIKIVIAKLKTQEPILYQNIAKCLPTIGKQQYSNGVKDAALLIDIFGFFGLFSAAAHSGRNTAEALPTEIVEELQKLAREMIQ